MGQHKCAYFEGPPPLSINFIVQKQCMIDSNAHFAYYQKYDTKCEYSVWLYFISGKQPVIKTVTCYGNISFLLCDNGKLKKTSTYKVQF